MIQDLTLQYETFDSMEKLSVSDQELLSQAREATQKAYAPYSKFHVGAAAILENGTIYSSANQENASYPAGICAERVLIGTISSLTPHAVIGTMAISYHNLDGISHEPISPCGICRQVLSEYENVQQAPMRIILSGFDADSPIIILPNVRFLLPFVFSAEDMK